MSASRRAQVQALCGVRSGPLVDRIESYIAAIDVWSRRGNAKAVRSAGTGVIAVCCLLAAESLDLQTPDRTSAIRASGLTPDKFATAERDFRGAVQTVSRSASSTSAVGTSPATSNAFVTNQRVNASLSATRPAKSSPLASPEKSKTAATTSGQQALLAKAQAVQAGSLFDKTMRTNSSPAAYSSKNPQAESIVPIVGQAVNGRSAHEANSPTRRLPTVPRVRPTRRKRMSRLVFGLDVHNSLARRSKDEQATEQRSQRLRRDQIYRAVTNLGTTDSASWHYHDFPRDFLLSISRDTS